ncbi:nucleolar GTP-binding protein 1 [Coccinella septempunctata]|uniref:nucleolar GTP-binding protein 1 n=1 Tax=Coccinella septempunctata TaxID=41139 RepID=UPI001D06092D|nr:nucleolar GTP-binding protein 1 [Coccinella septempunctata]
MATYNFKNITVVPTAKEFADIILSKTQRKTPTVVHKQYAIPRIRNFYTLKVKFCQQCYHDRLTQILTEFPKLDQIHPFYADLMNVLFDQDHYKISLGQINTARHLIDNVAKEHVKFIKYADSLYRCKQLKRAALGRMTKIITRQAPNLKYLEQVRQHLARMPSIDPYTRTIVLCGFPNVGKSSFINEITNAEVEVQPYAFTTKALYVGHTDFKYLRYQVIDTPGILDHPLEERNAIEMQAVAALVHLRACILYFMDLSEQCGHSLEEQIHLFESIKPMFVRKPLIIVVNKSDILSLEELSPEKRQLLAVFEKEKIPLYEMSTVNKNGVMEVKFGACETLLSFKVDEKMKTKKVDGILNRLHVAFPKTRDGIDRPPVIPPSVIAKKQGKAEIRKRKLERDLEVELADDYVLDLKKSYSEIPEDERWDVIPEMWNGHNIADFMDPHLFEKFAKLKEEEALRESTGMYEVPKIELDQNAREIKELALKIRHKRAIIKEEARVNKQNKKPVIPRTAGPRTRDRLLSKLKKNMENLGVDMSDTKNAHFTKTKQSKKTIANKMRMDVDDDTKTKLKKIVKPSRGDLGIKDAATKKKLAKIAHRAIAKKVAKYGLKGEADRFIGTKMPKHLYSGKRGSGSTDRR